MEQYHILLLAGHFGKIEQREILSTQRFFKQSLKHKKSTQYIREFYIQMLIGDP